MNPFRSGTTTAKSSLFVDNTSLLVSSFDPDELEQISYSETNNFVKWFDDDLFVLNSGKTELVNFWHGRDCIRGSSLHLGETEIGDSLYPTVSVRFLGLVLDRNLSFHSQIEQ